MSQTETNTSTPVPENFKKGIVDFISSFIASFPEYKDGIYNALDMQEYADVEFVPGDEKGTGSTKSKKPTDECIKTMSEKNLLTLLEHCKRVYPERFFDIIYQNEVIFSPDSAVSNNVNVEFLPNVDFRMVWNLSDVTETTKDHLWKHLQLVTFTILGNNSKDKLSLGDTAKLFEAIEEDELRSKLEETMSGIQTLFEQYHEDTNNDDDGDDGDNDANNQQPHEKKQEEAADEPKEEPGSHSSSSSSNSKSKSRPAQDSFPNAETIHEHLSGLLDGKIGALAKEIAEETVSELNIDVSNESSVSGVFQKLLKNPGKLTGIIKKVGEKLDKKMKSGDIKESELFKEASEFMSKMKSTKGPGGGKGGGMADFAQLFKAMNLNPSDLGGAAAGLNGKTKINMNAMQSQLNRNMKMALTKERMQKKLEERRAEQASATASASIDPSQMRHTVYQPANSSKNEKSMRVTMAPPVQPQEASECNTGTGYEPDSSSTNAKSKNKKNKKKK